jgi:hypothetical protein
MNTNAIAKNLAGLCWISDGRKCQFQSARAYGVVDATGRMLSTDGVQPSTWGTLAVAKTIAEHQAWPTTAVWLAVWS